MLLPIFLFSLDTIDQHELRLMDQALLIFVQAIYINESRIVEWE